MSVGNYTLTITTDGTSNTVTETLNIDVQYPVSSFSLNFLNMTGSPSQIIYSGSEFL